jgi:hypothetical protein
VRSGRILLFRLGYIASFELSFLLFVFSCAIILYICICILKNADFCFSIPPLQNLNTTAVNIASYPIMITKIMLINELLLNARALPRFLILCHVL